MWNRAIVLAAAAGLAAALLWYSQLRRAPAKVSGFIEAYEIRIGSRVGGRVQNVLAREGKRVEKGELLVALEPYDLNERRLQAVANLAARKAEYEKLAAGFRSEEIEQAKAAYSGLKARLAELEHGPREQEIAAAEAHVRLAEAELVLAQENLDRLERLVPRSAATKEELDEAVTALRVSRATLEVRQQELALLREGTRVEQIEAANAQLEQARQAWLLRQNGFRPEEVAQAKAAMQVADAALQAVEQQLAELKVVAPLEAEVEAVDLRPGDMISPNAPVLSLMDTSRLWVRAYVPENRLSLSIDQPLWVTVDSFPHERFRGRVSFISRQAEFTPSNVQTPEERSKQVFRIHITLEEGLDRLRPGMSADVWLDEVIARKNAKPHRTPTP
jgi:multidrug resistance efflux pump